MRKLFTRFRKVHTVASVNSNVAVPTVAWNSMVIVSRGSSDHFAAVRITLFYQCDFPRNAYCSSCIATRRRQYAKSSFRREIFVTHFLVNTIQPLPYETFIADEILMGESKEWKGNAKYIRGDTQTLLHGYAGKRVKKPVYVVFIGTLRDVHASHSIMQVFRGACGWNAHAPDILDNPPWAKK